MAQKKPKTYTPKFKFQLILEVLQGERSEVEIGRIYGVHHTTISKWKRHFLEHGAEVFGAGEEVERYEKRIAELERLIGQMTRPPESGPGTMRVRKLTKWAKGGLSKLGKGHSPEQIVRKLRQAEAKLASGSIVAEVARELGISEATYHRWKNRYGAMSTSEARRLRELEKENARLKKLLAEKELDIDILKEVSRGNF